MYRSIAAKALVLALSIIAAGVYASEQPPIRIGEIILLFGIAGRNARYRQGWELAQDQINGAGGVLGRKLEIISRDDAGQPQDAVRAAGELVNDAKVDLLAGTFLSNVGLAVAISRGGMLLSWPSQPLTDALIWEKQAHVTFRLRASTFTQAAVLGEGGCQVSRSPMGDDRAELRVRRVCRGELQERVEAAAAPDVEFVSEQWPPLNKIDAGAVIQAVMEAKPDANATFGADLAKLVREGTTRDAFADRTVVSILTGEPEYLAPLKEEAPPGWLVTGYPWSEIRTSEHASENLSRSLQGAAEYRRADRLYQHHRAGARDRGRR